MKKSTQQSGSITLGLVFGLGMLALGIAATTLTFSTNAVVNNSITSSGIRSLVTADSASREGVYRIMKDYAPDKIVTFTNTTLPLLNNTATAEVAITGSWPIYEVRSASTNDRVTRKIVSTLDLFPSAFAFDQAVYTHGQLNFNGNVTINGDVYATNGIDLSGSANISEDAYTPSTINTSGSANVDGDSVSNYDEILPPAIETTPYFTEATINGTYYGPGTGATASNIIKNANTTGTYYIDDMVDINGNSTDFTGTLLATGNVSLTGGDYTADGTNPLVLYVGGDLSLAGNVTINGIVYVQGQTTFGVGTPEINGALISVSGANSAGGGGNVTVTYDPVYAEAWQDITGLDTESGSEPKVDDWREE